MTGPVLVTGTGGLIGGAIARALLAQGRDVVGMDHVPPAGLDIPFLSHSLPDPHRWHEAFVRFGITHVVHAGGISGPMLMRDAPARLCDINLAGLVALLEAARIHRIARVVWFSSVMAYGAQPDLSPVTEATVLRPDTVYGATKAAGDALIEAFHAEHGVDAVSLRVASCYGPGRTTDCLMRTLVEDALAGRTTLVRDEPGVSRQHVFIDDVLSAVLAVLRATDLRQRAYNIGPGRAQSLEEIAAAVRSVLPNASVAADPAGMPWNTFRLGPLSIAAARRDFGFEPRTGLAEGAARTSAWVRERPSRSS
ncbi:NAD-dependent epimerase/dehydratase family protein [Enterovirga rhinocerotis]|uniref:UDP-glucose 4-epimerase n=1 Tax=Enterovirga rhinocerotis TaxID=1339210 RepID=A0A4R7BT57_9HYPH|nr:NAD(P)-dependent oxidoreductase [Enterovirga rhinocerotis]TDR88918.1 UDP-glucose 4-epimerase [Enterovirga rhinocerotis]